MMYQISRIKSSLLRIGATNITQSGDELRMCCPIHSEKNPSFSVNWKTLKYFDFHDSTGGHLFDLIAKQEGCSREEVKERLLLPPSFQLNLESLEKNRKRVDKSRVKTFKKFFDSLETDFTTPFRFISLKVLKDYQVKYSSLLKRIVIPIRDQKGNTCQYELRDIKKRLKKKVLYLQGVPVHDYLFNLYRAKKNKAVTLVEGTMDALSLISRGFNTVSSFGSYVSAAQKHLLVRYFNKIYVAFDPDKAGIEATKKVVEALKNFVDIINVKLPRDPDETKKQELIKCFKRQKDEF